MIKLTARIYLAGGEAVTVSIEGDNIEKLDMEEVRGGVVYAAYDENAEELEALFLPNNCPNVIVWDRS